MCGFQLNSATVWLHLSCRLGSSIQPLNSFWSSSLLLNIEVSPKMHQFPTFFGLNTDDLGDELAYVRFNWQIKKCRCLVSTSDHCCRNSWMSIIATTALWRLLPAIPACCGQSSGILWQCLKNRCSVNWVHGGMVLKINHTVKVLSLMCFCSLIPSQYLSLVTILFSSHAQDSISVPLRNNYRKTQSMEGRVVLVSFKEGEYGL